MNQIHCFVLRKRRLRFQTYKYVIDVDLQFAVVSNTITVPPITFSDSIKPSSIKIYARGKFHRDRSNGVGV